MTDLQDSGGTAVLDAPPKNLRGGIGDGPVSIRREKKPERPSIQDVVTALVAKYGENVNEWADWRVMLEGFDIDVRSVTTEILTVARERARARNRFQFAPLDPTKAVPVCCVPPLGWFRTMTGKKGRMISYNECEATVELYDEKNHAKRTGFALYAEVELLDSSEENRTRAETEAARLEERRQRLEMYSQKNRRNHCTEPSSGVQYPDQSSSVAHNNPSRRCVVSLRVKQSDAARLLRAVGCVNEKVLTIPKKIQNRINNLAELASEPGFKEPSDPEDKKLFKEISEAISADGEGAVEVVPEGNEAGNGASAGKTKSKKGAASTKASAPKATATKKPAAPREKTSGKLSAIDAAVKVLKEHRGKAMTCGDLIEEMSSKGYWTSPGGATPAATLNAAIIREIAKKGSESRFVKVDRGLFGLA